MEHSQKSSNHLTEDTFATPGDRVVTQVHTFVFTRPISRAITAKRRRARQPHQAAALDAPSLESSRGLRTERSKKNLTSEADMEHRPGREVGRLKEAATGARTRPANGRFPSVPWSPGRPLWRVLPRPVARGKRGGSVSGEETRVLRATRFGERFS